jgi:hypothetical protein
MFRIKPRRWVALAVLAAVPVALPLDAGAAPPEVFHGHFLDVLENEEVCGITVDLVSQGVFSDKVFFDTDGNFVRFQSSASGKTTLTAEDGRSVVVQFADVVSEGVPIVDEEAGTITFVTSIKGLPEKIQTARGRVLLRDAGVIVFANTFDLETEELISSEILVNKGPHPEADSDFVLFCEVISEALG